MRDMRGKVRWRAWYYGVIYRIYEGVGSKRRRKRGGGYRARWWIVEAAHSWMNRFRKLLVRYEKLYSSYIGLLMFACAFIAFRKAGVI
jgi:hypothetical protein